MSKAQAKWPRVLGWVLHGLMAALMIFAGVMKVVSAMPKEEVAKLTPGIQNNLVLIGVGEIIAAVLLLIPRTLSLGTLVFSGLWGGVICYNMADSKPYAPFAVALILTWLGSWLRLPATFASFSGAGADHREWPD
jgi:hypothetical protein